MSEHLLNLRPKSGLTLFSALIGGQTAADTPRYALSWRIKFLLRSLLMPLGSWRHMRHIANSPTMQQAWPQQRALPAKIHRHYLQLGLSASQRATALYEHYAFVGQLGCLPLRQAMLSPTGVELARFSGKEGERLAVRMMCCGRCEREGEVNLELSCDGVVLAVLTFAVTAHDDRPQLTIGGLQGAHREAPHTLIRDATKACHGLFPKRLLLEALLLLAAALGIQRIVAVGDSGHVYHSPLYRYKKRDVLHACYDEFWLSLGAAPISRRLYQLPPSIPRRPPEEIASKKRAEYRRRYALLAELEEQFSRFY